MKKVLFLLCAAFLMPSCQSVDIIKRKYSGGYYLNLKNDKRPSGNNKTEVATNNTLSGIAHQQILPAQIAPATLSAVSNATTTQQKQPAHSCGVITKEKESRSTTTDKSADKHVITTPKPTPPADGGTDANRVVMIILALLIPPLAIWLKEGITQRFWIDLICFLLGGGLFFTPLYYGGALMLFAIVFAVLIVLDMI
jgi:uncharacterized membrane protein YqaE (UPF0057 family)